MFTQKTRNALVLASLIAGSIAATPSLADPSTQHLSAASGHSAAASAHAGAAAVKGVAAVAATPLIAVGASGMASGAAGSALHEYANEPLRIGHKVLHTGPQNSPTTSSPSQQLVDPEPGKKQ